MTGFACVPQSSGKVPPKVVNGEIDLTGWDFKKDGPVKLDGDWLFAWEKTIEPGSWQQIEEKMTSKLKVPGLWHTLSDPKNSLKRLPGTGFASYAVRIKGISEVEPIAFLVKGQQFAAKTQILNPDGNKVREQYRGTFATNKELEVPIYNVPSILETVTADQILLVHISNFHYPRGGTLTSFSLGLERASYWQATYYLMLDAIMSGVLLIIGLSYLGLFLFRRDDKSTLFFGLFSLTLFLRMFSMGIAQQMIYDQSFFHWQLLISIEFLSMPLGLISFLCFLNTLIPHIFIKNLAKLFSVLGLPLAIIAILAEPLFFGQYLYLYQLHISTGLLIGICFLFYLSVRGQLIGRLVLFVLLCGATGIINDILYARGLLSTGYIAPYTMLAFILLQSGIISYRSAKAFTTAAYLSENLRKEVNIRTDKLKRIQFLSQQIQNKATFQEIEGNIKTTLQKEYGIKNFIFYVLNSDHSKFYPYSISLKAKNAEQTIEQLKKVNLDIKHPRSSYASVIRKKRALYLPRLPNQETEPTEDIVRSILRMKSMYLVPLKIDDEVFAVFSLSDTMLEEENEQIIKNLTKEQRKDIEQLSEFVSAALFQSLQKDQVKQVQERLEKQTEKLNRIQYLSQQIQNNSDLDTMIKNLNYVLDQEFKIPGYNFFLLNQDKNQLEVFKFEFNYNLPKSVNAEVYRTPLELSHPKSLHGGIVKKGKPYFLSRLLDIENAPDEMRVRELLGMKSLFFLPLKIDGEVFAALSMVDTKFQEKDRIKFLTREERLELVQLSEFVSSALYQALQKGEIEKAQAVASRAKNEAAISQLAAHLAHEVNNPLNYIATGKTMQSDSFDKYHDMILGVLTGDDEDSIAFKEELESLQAKFKLGLEQTDEGQARIAKVIAEIRAITGVDGLNLSNFDLVPIINEELIYSLQRNQIKSGEQSVRVTGTNDPLMVLSNPQILARSIRTVVSNCIHFARSHRGNEGELYIDCKIDDNMLLIEIGNNSNSIKSKKIQDMMFNLETSRSHGTEQIGMAMIKELLQKINCDLVLADHGRESGKVVFQLQVPLES